MVKAIGLLKALSLVLAMALLASCAARTEVMLVVDTDLRGEGGIDNFTVEITAPDGAMRSSSATLGAGQAPLPRTLGIVYDRGALGPFTVRVVGNTGAAARISRVARFSFQRGRTLTLRIDLLAQCISIACSGDQSCAAGACRSIDIDPSELSEWSGTPPALPIDASVPTPDGGMDASVVVDAGGSDAGPVDGGSDSGTDGGTDACVPATETCNMLDDDCNGTVDDGFDLMTDEANCGACGQVCDFQDATGECLAGVCEITACDTGFDDCNMIGDDGCESELATSERDCGACGTRCNTGAERTCCAGTCARSCP